MWAIMMTAMTSTILKRVNGSDYVFSALPFVGSYLTVWSLVGVPIYALYQPHGFPGAGLLIIAIGLYELTPFKQFCRQRCCAITDSGLKHGLYCVGSCLGLMLMQVALGIMSITWMLLITTLVTTQKLLPPKAVIDNRAWFYDHYLTFDGRWTHAESVRHPHKV